MSVVNREQAIVCVKAPHTSRTFHFCLDWQGRHVSRMYKSKKIYMLICNFIKRYKLSEMYLDMIKSQINVNLKSDMKRHYTILNNSIARIRVLIQVCCLIT